MYLRSPFWAIRAFTSPLFMAERNILPITPATRDQCEPMDERYLELLFWLQHVEDLYGFVLSDPQKDRLIHRLQELFEVWPGGHGHIGGSQYLL